MKLFSRIPFIAKRDYWSLSDFEIKELARKYNIKKGLIERNDVLEFGENKDWIRHEGELDESLREEIIKELVKRDKFVRDYVAIAISILALLVSFLK